MWKEFSLAYLNGRPLRRSVFILLSRNKKVFMPLRLENLIEYLRSLPTKFTSLLIVKFMTSCPWKNSHHVVGIFSLIWWSTSLNSHLNVRSMLLSKWLWVLIVFAHCRFSAMNPAAPLWQINTAFSSVFCSC